MFGTLAKPQNFDEAKKAKWIKDQGFFQCEYCMEFFYTQESLKCHKASCAKNLSHQKSVSNYLSCAREAGGVSQAVVLEKSAKKEKPKPKVGFKYNGPYGKHKAGAFLL